MTCGTCTHKDKTTPANMVALGFVRCQFVPLGGIFGSVKNRECRHYKPAPTEIVEKRIEFSTKEK